MPSLHDAGMYQATYHHTVEAQSYLLHTAFVSMDA